MTDSPASGVTPMLSVTVLNYNYGHYLPSCLDSILRQTFRDIEVIVIDDCSSDDSLAVLEPYRRDPRVRVVAHAQNVGFAGSLREGTEALSRAPFVSVISADDVVRRDEAFALQMAPLLARADIVMSFSAIDRFFSDTGEIYDVHHSLDGDAVLEQGEGFRRFLTDRRVWAMHSGTIVRRSAYDACGGYPNDIRTSVDFALWAEITQEGAVAYCDQVLYGYRTHRDQMSRTSDAAQQTVREFGTIIGRACDRAEHRGWDIGTVRRDGLQCMIGGLILHDAFSDRPRLAIVGALTAIRCYPRYMLSDRDLFVAMLRAAIGRRVYGFVRSAVRRIPGQRAGRGFRDVHIAKRAP
jgi:hypothetical protein